MEVGTEISQKIRSAIKAKLMELGAYVDDELPDYIMVMVANKRSRTQMRNDLCLFLGTNTNSFTGWLHKLLAKLQAVRSGDTQTSVISKQEKHSKLKSKDKEKCTIENINSHLLKRKIESDVETGSSDINDTHSVAKRKTTVVATATLSIIQANKSEESYDMHVDAVGVEGSESQQISRDKKLEQVSEDFSYSSDVPTEKVPENTDNNVSENIRHMSSEEHDNSLENTVKNNCETLIDNQSLISEPAGEIKIVDDIYNSNNLTSSCLSIQSSELCEKSSAAAPDNTESVAVSIISNEVDRVSNLEHKTDPQDKAVKINIQAVKTDRQTESSILDSQQPDENSAQQSATLASSLQLETIKEALAEVLHSTLVKNDDIAHFCQMLESSLRKLNQLDLSIAKLHIQQVLVDLEIGTLQNDLGKNIRGGSANESVCQNCKEMLSPNSNKINHELKSNSTLKEFSETDNCLGITSSDLESPLMNKQKISEATIRSSLEESKATPGLSPKTLTSVESHDPDLQVNSQTANMIKRESSSSKYQSGGEQLALSPGSSNKNEPESPSSVHSGSLGASYGQNVKRTVLSASRESTLSPVDLHLKPSTSLGHRSKSILSKNKPSASILVNSIHNRKKMETLQIGSSVLRQSSQKDTSPRADVPRNDSEDSPRQIGPEALKVLAKNLKITVINKKAVKPEGESSSEDESDDNVESSDDGDDADSNDEDEEEVSGTAKPKIKATG